MSGLCYWCESRGVVQCKNCMRNFCEFYIKNGYSQSDEKLVCFVCGCFQITENANGNNFSGLRNREMQDMLHRYENLCNNDKLENSIKDLLTNIDKITSDQLPDLFETIKNNIFSMLHDIQKVELMVNHALEDKRNEDVQGVLMPLLKVVTKHHLFKRLGRPELISGTTIGKEEPPFCENNDKSIDNFDGIEKEMNEFIDLTDDDRMDVCRNNFNDNSSDNERMQRSPLCLAEEEKFTSKFEIQIAKDDDEWLDIPMVFCDPPKKINYKNNDVSKNEIGRKSTSLSLVSSQLESNEPMKASPKSANLDEGVFESPQKSEDKSTPKKRRSKQSIEIERRSVRLRSETVCDFLDLSASIVIPISKTSENYSSISRVQSDFSDLDIAFENQNVNNNIDKVNQIDSMTKKNYSRKNLAKATLSDMSDKGKSPDKYSNQSQQSSLKTSEISFKLEMNCECPSFNNINDECNSCSMTDMNKFVRVPQKRKNSHLVCPAPITYEKPFLIKDPQLDDLKLANTSGKTWSWERQSPCVIPVKSKSITNGDLSKILNKPIVIQKGLIDSNQTTTVGGVVVPTRGRPRLSNSVVKKRPSSPQFSSQDGLDEPKKKRGRPRKYFNTYTNALDYGEWKSNESNEDRSNRNSSDLNDFK